MFVIDGFGEVWRSNAEKDSWSNLLKPDNNQYRSLAAYDDVILLGSTNGIHRSVDGGLTFETVYDGPGNFLHRLGENNWIAHSGGLRVSRDNGITWNWIITRDQNGRQILNIQLVTFTDTSKGYLVDRNPARVYRYINEALWEELEPLHTTDIHAIHAKGNRVWLLGPDNQIQVSDDNGQSWSYQDVGLSVGLRSMSMIDENKGWIMTDSLGVLLHTKDGGTSWTTIDTGFDFQIYALDYLDEDRIWLTGSNSTILKSEDGGITFKKQSTPGIVNRDSFTIRTIKVLSDTSGFAAGDHGVILSYGKPLHSDNNNGEYGPDELILYQNYPNPFNPATTIRYVLGESASVQINVYTVTGQKLVTLINEERNAGVHDVIFSGKGLVSGLYFYTISLNGRLQGTRKMLLIK
ncbi:MAG: T9SS type A sorting domain-containing protein [Rhodothermaceae bacterium]|nr:T9SS type A sorting domain-containing protein [Rhodothermaceae bacterium]